MAEIAAEQDFEIPSEGEVEDFAEDVGDEIEDDYDSDEGEELMGNLLDLAKQM